MESIRATFSQPSAWGTSVILRKEISTVGHPFQLLYRIELATAQVTWAIAQSEQSGNGVTVVLCVSSKPSEARAPKSIAALEAVGYCFEYLKHLKLFGHNHLKRFLGPKENLLK